MTRTFHPRWTALAIAAGLLCFVPAAAPAAAQDASPVHAERLEEGLNLLEEGKLKEAVRALREADKLGKGSCLECHLGLMKAFNQLGAHGDTLKHAEAALRLTTDARVLAEIHNQRGMALLALAGENPKKLAEAETAFRQALELSSGKSNGARFNLGYTLLRLSRDSEGIPLLQEYLKREPQAANAESAKELIANPLRARKRLVPDFELVTLAGSYITAEELRGKVLLLDFWATWCAPCIAAVPSLRSMSRRMEKNPFVLLSISADNDEALLRRFVADNEMSWPQVWDKRGEFTRRCKVESFPTYVLVDHEGEIVYATRGWGEAIERELNQRIFSAIRAAKASAARKGS